MLGPVLERLANEPDSNFILAKLNTDQNQGIAMRYGIRGIPAVKAFRNGNVVHEFVGAQPEPMVRQFLQVVTAGAAPRPQRKAQKASSGGDPAARLRQARQLLSDGKGCEAQRLLEGLTATDQAAAAQSLLPLSRFMCTPLRTGDGAIDSLYEQAANSLRRRDYGAALYQLLSALNQQTPANKQKTREIMHALFSLLGDSNPLVPQYRALVG